MKSEPEVYSITDLQHQRETIWDGVRNDQACNFLLQMQLGDLAFSTTLILVPLVLWS
ncbi:EVE domain-containing protein [Trichormus azollae]|uniref:EVE domain-containing protein n=1 Tax=Trichormus azollae TaxID=1164 RepID=UPI00325F9653